MASERTSSLDPTDWIGEKIGKIEREKKEERERINSRERNSTFSLEFPVIRPSNPGETRGKLIPTARATRGYRYCGVSTNSGGRGFLLLGLVLVYGPC